MKKNVFSVLKQTSLITYIHIFVFSTILTSNKLKAKAELLTNAIRPDVGHCVPLVVLCGSFYNRLLTECGVLFLYIVMGKGTQVSSVLV